MFYRITQQNYWNHVCSTYGNVEHPQRHCIRFSKYLYNIIHHPDVLDLELVYFPTQLRYNLENHNDLLSDHNSQIISISTEPSIISPPVPKKRTNWEKFETELSHQIKIKQITNILTSITK